MYGWMYGCNVWMLDGWMDLSLCVWTSSAILFYLLLFRVRIEQSLNEPLLFSLFFLGNIIAYLLTHLHTSCHTCVYIFYIGIHCICPAKKESQSICSPFGDTRNTSLVFSENLLLKREYKAPPETF